MKFTKMHGAGNDYIYIDARDMEEDWPGLSRRMSDRHFGVGGDGIILILESQVADLKMRMFNADGSEGEMCGNGIRCFAKYAIERGLVPAGVQSIAVETLAGVRTIEPVYQGNIVTGATVAMGIPVLDPPDIPVALEPAEDYQRGPVLDYHCQVDGIDLELTFVSMGNPHAVAFLDQPVESFPLHTIGPKVEHLPIFPNRVNFEIVHMNGDITASARIWERGSGETMACGTGACAIAVAADLHAMSRGPIDIILPGGVLNIDWDGSSEVLLQGDAVEVFSGEWNVSR